MPGTIPGYRRFCRRRSRCSWPAQRSARPKRSTTRWWSCCSWSRPPRAVPGRQKVEPLESALTAPIAGALLSFRRGLLKHAGHAREKGPESFDPGPSSSWDALLDRDDALHAVVHQALVGERALGGERQLVLGQRGREREDDAARVEPVAVVAPALDALR